MSSIFSKISKGFKGINKESITSDKGLMTALGVGGVLGALAGGTSGVKRTLQNVGAIGGSALLAGVAYNMYKNWKGGNNTQPNTQTPNQQIPNNANGGSDLFSSISDFFGGSSDKQAQVPAQNNDNPFAQYNAQQSQAPDPVVDQASAELMIEAMIYAARADGFVDESEQQTILNTAKELAPHCDLNNFIRECLAKPLDPNDIARRVNNTQQAQDIYRLSAITIFPDTDKEQQYLVSLSRALNLDANTKAKLDQEAAAFRSQISSN